MELETFAQFVYVPAVLAPAVIVIVLDCPGWKPVVVWQLTWSPLVVQVHPEPVPTGFEYPEGTVSVTVVVGVLMSPPHAFEPVFVTVIVNAAAFADPTCTAFAVLVMARLQGVTGATTGICAHA